MIVGDNLLWRVTMEESTKRYFIAAARTAARAARTEEDDVDGLRILVTPSSGALNGYQWEIRSQGGVVLEKSIETYRTSLLAHNAGVQALVGDSKRT